jgi:pimeloyl-[acyl-carrier protein] synthase
MSKQAQNIGLKVFTGVMGTFERAQSGVVFNPFSKEVLNDPYPTYRAMRERDPVHRSWLGAGWVLTRFADIRQLLNDPRLGNDLHLANWWKWIEKRQLKAGRTQEELDDPNLIMSDPPRHTRLRALVNKAFTPDSIRALAPKIHRIAGELLDQAGGGGQMELVRALAYPLPVLVIAELMGVPVADRDQFREWSDAMAGSTGTFALEDIRRSVDGDHAIHRYLQGVIEERRKDPQDDLLTRLVQVEENGDRLTMQELLALCSLLLVAGNVTTRGLISNGMHALLRHPEQLQRLREKPELLEDGVNELARYDSSVQLVARFPKEDIELGGKRIKKGTMISMLMGAANRDPERFAEPDRLDLTRDNTQFLVFGHGIHYCLGHYLARMNARIAIGALLERFPYVKLASEPPKWGTNWVMRSLETLPVAVAK